MTDLAQWLSRQPIAEDLCSVIASMAAAGADIVEVLEEAPLTGLVGLVGSVNVQGEEQKQLDVVSNDIVLKHLRQNPAVSILVSEELDEAVNLEAGGAYMVATDPLDGSSNLDVNVTVGTIFSVLRADGGLTQPAYALLSDLIAVRRRHAS